MIKNMMLWLGLVCGMTAVLPAQGGRVAGDGPKEWPANPAKHVITIARVAEDETGKKMIAAAEAAPSDTGVWWMTEDGNPVFTHGLKTPYAITNEALDYYTGLIKEYQKKTWKAYSEPRSSLEYKPVVARHETFTLKGKDYKNVIMVKMTLKFSVAYVSGDGGMDFLKTRTVVLDEKAQVLAIDGDANERFPEWMH